MKKTADGEVSERAFVHVDPGARKIYLTGHVTQQAAHEVNLALWTLDRSEGDITLVLNSEGGNEPDGLAIHDAARCARHRVVTEGYGWVQSIAAVIFQAGDWRRLAPEATYMIHDGSYDAGELTQPQLEALEVERGRVQRRYYRLMAARTGIPPEMVRDLSAAETHLGARQALKLGFCDEVILYRRLRPARSKKR